MLLVSEMHRTESDMDPSLFQYHDHFDSPWTLVGKTHSSEVFSVRHRASGEVFAVKRSRRRFRSKLQRERCLREIRAVAALPSHPNIVVRRGGGCAVQTKGGCTRCSPCIHAFLRFTHPTAAPCRTSIVRGRREGIFT